MKVTIITKVGCGRCLLLKQKLKLMGVLWDEATAIDGLALEGKQLPITIINGEPYEYAAAIKRVKEITHEDDNRAG